MAAILAVGVLGTAVAPAFGQAASTDGDKAKSSEATITSATKEIAPVCKLTIPSYGLFKATQEDINDKGLHSKLTFPGAEGWLACNSKSVTLATSATLKEAEHTGLTCKVYQSTDLAALDGGTLGSTAAGLCESEPTASATDASTGGPIDTGIWYQVEVTPPSRGNDAQGNPLEGTLAAGSYTVVLTSTATAN